MGKGVNLVFLIGNLGKDPEMRATGSGNSVTNIVLATSESWKDKKTGQMEERTEWHRIVFFNRLAEIAGEYLRKGSKIWIEGQIRTRKWQADDGSDRYTTEIVANKMQMLDAKVKGPQSAEQATHAQEGNESAQNRYDLSDDIPF